jgi:hypothetical protein
MKHIHNDQDKMVANLAASKALTGTVFAALSLTIALSKIVQKQDMSKPNEKTATLLSIWAKGSGAKAARVPQDKVRRSIFTARSAILGNRVMRPMRLIMVCEVL